MSYIKHHSIIITAYSLEDATIAKEKAKKIFKKYKSLVSDIIPSITNGYYTLFVATDGSKYGWDIEVKCTERRAKLCRWLEKKGYDYAEVSYGGDDNLKYIH